MHDLSVLHARVLQRLAHIDRVSCDEVCVLMCAGRTIHVCGVRPMLLPCTQV